MRFPQPLTLAQTAEFLGCAFKGDPNHLVVGLNEIHRVQPGDLTFSDVRKYFKKALESAATTILLNEDVELPAGKGILVSDDPFRDFNRLALHFAPRTPLDTAHTPNPDNLPEGTRLGRNVVLGENVRLGRNVEIGHGAVIGSDVSIGDGTLIYPNVTVYDHTDIGRECIIHANAVIGSDAFYYKKREWGREKMHSSGRTSIGNFVEIGAGTTIDRGVSDVTSIGDYTKLDNLVQVGHDVVIGSRVVIASQVGVAGVSVIEDDALLWGQVGLATESHIQKGAVVMAKSGVMNPVPPGQTWFGYPAREAKRQWRIEVVMEKLSQRWPEIERMLDGKGGE